MPLDTGYSGVTKSPRKLKKAKTKAPSELQRRMKERRKKNKAQ